MLSLEIQLIIAKIWLDDNTRSVGVILAIVLFWSLRPADVWARSLAGIVPISAQEARLVNKINNLTFDRRPSSLEPGAAFGRAFSVKPVLKNATSHASFERDEQAVCPPTAELAFDPGPLRSFLSSQNLTVAFQSIRDTQLLLVTQPELVSGGSRAAYYVVLVGLDRCDTSGVLRMCSLRASASLKVAPVADGTVRSRNARDENDRISNTLLEIASSKTVREVTFWCVMAGTIRQKMKSLEY